ncbi:MAG: NCS2 family permease [Candidatus Zixiibacteriota bacterium]
MRGYFKLDELGTTVRQEIIAGTTTFVTMAYVMVVNPKILEAAGIPFGPSMVATILSAFFGTLAMGIYAKRPFAIAPYMGENAFIAFTVVGVLGYSWQTALGAIFIGGVLFTLVTVLRIRTWLANAIPQSMKIAFAVAIGFFLTFIGLVESGIVTSGSGGVPVHVGNFHDGRVVLALVAFLLISFLMIKRVKAAILIGILGITVLGFGLGIAELPDKWVSMPPGLGPIFAQMDPLGALHWGFLAVVLTVFVMDFVDTTGTLIGLSFKAELLDEEGNLPEVEKPMLCDSVATVVAAVLGTTTTGTYLESAAGIESGGKSGLTSVVTAVLFLAVLFFSPFVEAIPSFAYGQALIVVGMLMLSPIAKVNFDDLTEVVPVFCVVAFMSFTYNPGIGMTAGFVTYPLLKLLSGRVREVPVGLWILGGISLLFFLFYPY